MKGTAIILLWGLLSLSGTWGSEVGSDRFGFEIPPLEKSQLRYGAALQGELDPNHLSVLVWNIYKGEKDHFDRDITTLGPKYDLMMIQEALTTRMDVFRSIPGVRYDFGISFGYKKDPNKFTGTMIGSKVNPARAWIARTTETEPIIGTPKVLTMATYKFMGRTESLLLINIHGLNVTTHGPYIRHVELAIEQMKGHSGPIVFAGDFNSRTQRRLEETREMLSRLGFSEMSFRNDERMRGKLGGEILDHVFYRGLEIIDSEVLGHLESSDHKAMSFEARLLE